MSGQVKNMDCLRFSLKRPCRRGFLKSLFCGALLAFVGRKGASGESANYRVDSFPEIGGWGS